MEPLEHLPPRDGTAKRWRFGNEKSKSELADFKPDACLKLMPVLPNGDASYDVLARWCRTMYLALDRASVPANDVILLCAWVRRFQKTGTATSKNPRIEEMNALRGEPDEQDDPNAFLRLAADTVEALYQLDHPTLKKQGLQHLLRCAFLNARSREVSFEATEIGVGFLCNALDLAPSDLCEFLLASNLDTLSEDPKKRARVPAHCREQLYCVISYLEVDFTAKSAQQLSQRIGKNWESLTPVTFLQKVESISGMRLPPWETRSRRLRFVYGWSDHRLRQYVKALKKSHGLEGDRLLDCVFGKISFADGPTHPSAEDARIFQTSIATHLQYCAERSIDSSAQALFVYAKNLGYSSDMQRAVIKRLHQATPRAPDDMAEALEELLHFIQEHKAEQKNAFVTATNRALDNPLPVRWMTGFARGAIAQIFGRSVSGALTLYAFPLIMLSANPMAAVGGILLADGLLRGLSAGYLFYKQATTDVGNNERRISKILTSASMAAALVQPVIALALLRHEVTENDENESLLKNVGLFGGVTGYLAVQLLNATLSRTLRQVLQTLTTTNWSAGVSVTYANGDPLAEDDRECLNAIRDVLYVASTAATVLPGSLASGLPLVWGAMALSGTNEGIDEMNPDLAVCLFKLYRDIRSTFKDSEAQLVYSAVPTLSVLDQDLSTSARSFVRQSASRITHFGMSDLFSMMGDLSLLDGNRAAFLAFKTTSILVSAIYGGRRGTMTSYQTAGGNTMPSGLLTWCLRMIFGVRDATDRIQVTPVVKGQIQSLDYDSKRFKFRDAKLSWGWAGGKRIAIDGKLVAYTYAGDALQPFHQAEANHAKVAVFNMLCMHVSPGEYLLLIGHEEATTLEKTHTLQDLCDLHSSRKEAVRIKKALTADSIRLLQTDFMALDFVFIGSVEDALTQSGVEEDLLKWLGAQAAIGVSCGAASTEAIFIRCDEAGCAIYSPLTDEPLNIGDLSELTVLQALQRFLKRSGCKSGTEITMVFAMPRPEEEINAAHIAEPSEPQPIESGSGNERKSAGVASSGIIPEKSSKKIYVEAGRSKRGAPLHVVNMLRMYTADNEPKSRFAKPDGKQYPGFQDLAAVSKSGSRSHPLLAVARNERIEGAWTWRTEPPNLRTLSAVGVRLIGQAKNHKPWELTVLLAKDKANASVVYYIDPLLASSVQETGEHSLIESVRALLRVHDRATECELVFPVLLGSTEDVARHVLGLFENAIQKRKPAGQVVLEIQEALAKVPKQQLPDARSAIFWAFEAADEREIGKTVQQDLFLAAVRSISSKLDFERDPSGPTQSEGDAERAWNRIIQSDESTHNSVTASGGDRSDSP